MELCTCGCVDVHTIAIRETADGCRVRIWSDGMVTHADPFGTHIRGIGPARALRNAAAYAGAGRTVVELIGFFDFAELPTLVKVARVNAGHAYASEDMRKKHVVSTTSKKVVALKRTAASL